MKNLNIVYKNINDIKKYEKNPRKNEKAIEYVAKSIKKFGFKNPIIIDTNNIIICGHTRYLASLKLGLKQVPCIMVEDLTEDQIKEYRIIDNKTNELSSWDFELLKDEISSIDDFSFQDIFELEEKIDEIKDLKDDLNLDSKYLITIECESELQQEEIFYKLTEMGIKCRVQNF